MRLYPLGFFIRTPRTQVRFFQFFERFSLGAHKAPEKSNLWQGKKDSNLRMLESKSSALTNLATPLHGWATVSSCEICVTYRLNVADGPTNQWMHRQIAALPYLPALGHRWEHHWSRLLRKNRTA
jgi:hypothetical protein